jgi:hypothetical protein
VEFFLVAIGFLWCAGVGIAAARKLNRHVRLAKVVERAEIVWFDDSPLPIRLSNEISGPMLYGLWRPAILLPRNLSNWSTSEERLAMIRHECAHFTRMDQWTSMVEGFVRTIFFFHPMFRWLCRRLDVEREILCDAEVLRRGSDPKIYTKALLDVAEHAVVQPGGVYFASATALNERIELVLRRPNKPMRAPLVAAALVSLMPLVALGFSQSVVPALEPVESTWVRRFLPTAPLERIRPAIVVSTPGSRWISTQRPQEPVPVPPEQQPMGLRSSLLVLRGQGGGNEVRVTVGIPYANLTFTEPTTGGGISARRASATVSLTVETVSGILVARREDPIEIDVPNRIFSPEGIAVVQEGFLLFPESYRLIIQVNDVVGGTRNTLDRRLDVPQLRGTALAASSLVVADLISVNPPRAAPWLQFVIGDFKVRPSVTRRFRSTQELNIFQQIYNNGSGPLDLEIQIRTPENRILKRLPDKLQPASQIEVTKTIPLSDVPAGSYIVQTVIMDPATGASVLSSEDFTVE